jgi:Ca2+-binding EF-hand superfamily protein
VRACIRKHDQDHDRKLTYDEFRSVIRDLGYPINVSEAYRITVRLDSAKKGLLIIRKLLKFLGSPERYVVYNDV